MAKPIELGSFRDHRTIVVRVQKRLVWRMRLGVAVIRLGAWIATFGYRVEEDS